MGAVQGAMRNPRVISAPSQAVLKRRTCKPSAFNAKLSLPHSECFVDAATLDYFAANNKNELHWSKEHGLHLTLWGTR